MFNSAYAILELSGNAKSLPDMVGVYEKDSRGKVFEEAAQKLVYIVRFKRLRERRRVIMMMIIF